MPLAEWLEQLAATAMLGTERASSAPTSASGVETLDGIIATISPSPRERALLAAAGIASVYTRAGLVPGTVSTMPSIAPAPDKPIISPTSAQHLALLLAGHHGDVLPEYLDLAAQNGCALPARYLPTVLTLAARDIQLRPRVLAVLGTRGQWLATHNPDWAKMSDAPAVDHYQTGTSAERLAVLNYLRKSDPAQARNLMASTWAEESPEDRAVFIQTLTIGLSMEDEPFLESALDDKRKEVRIAAADLLAVLPDSRLSLRMIERLTPLVSVTKKLLGRTKLAINVPDSFDPQLARDGIDAKSARRGLGDKAAHLAGIIAASPLSFWKGLLSSDPTTLLKLVHDLEWKDAVIAGLVIAAIRQRNAEFISAILVQWTANTPDSDRSTDTQDIDRLITVLTPEQREGLLAPLLADRGLLDNPLLLHMLMACRHAWTKTFSEGFLPLLWRIVEAEPKNYWGNQALSKVFGLYANPAILSAISARLGATPDIRSDTLDSFLSTLQFRHDIHKGF
jgi:Family of unknown function (DUF5691)